MKAKKNDKRVFLTDVYVVATEKYPSSTLTACSRVSHDVGRSVTQQNSSCVCPRSASARTTTSYIIMQEHMTGKLIVSKYEPVEYWSHDPKG